jgi:predicted AAA+ superfamily ATPase
LGIEDEKQVARDPLAGSLFENLVVVEALKARYNKGLDANLYFYRDSNQNEVDLIYKQGSHLFPIEIKYGSTWHDGFARSVLRFNVLAGNSESGAVVYGGENNFQTRDKVNAVGYQQISQFLNSI